VIHFTAPVTMTLGGLDLVVQTGSLIYYQPIFYVTVHPTTSIGGTLGPAMQTYSSGSIPGLGWHDWISHGLSLGQPPAALVGGQTYALSVVGAAIDQSLNPVANVYVCNGLTNNPAAATQLPSQLTPYGCATSFPATGTIGLMARFRGASCAPGPLASMGPPLGTPCGFATPFWWLTAMPPVLGTLWWADISAGWPMAGLSAHLFWAGGVNAAGSPIAPGSSCLNYLDLNSLGALFALGAEPFASATFSSNGYVFWPAMVPASPAFVGTTIGIQALVIGPAGTIPLGSGVFGGVSNALPMTIGY
jgi:hypothetical protein